MSGIGARLSLKAKKALGAELHMFLAYAFIIFRPGAPPPPHPASAAPDLTRVPTTWGDDGYKQFIDEARIDIANQRADKGEVRARAQTILTIAIALGGAFIASYSRTGNSSGVAAILYALAAVALMLTLLATGGLISARSDIGAVNLADLARCDESRLHHTLAQQYASTRSIGAETIAVMVTVLRDCVLALVVGAALLAVAHLTQ